MADPASECVVYPPWFHPCRDSDAAVFLHSSSDFDLGRIVRTTFRVHGGGVYGSLVIDDANPYFQIVGEYSSPPVGAIVNKIGQTSGWTHGLVRYTCMDVTLTHPVIPTYRIKCATNATYTSASGDSGSPVFTWDPGSATVLLTCMNFGHMGDGAGLYSPLALIESEVGNLTVVASGGGGSPPPVQVTIQGPTQVPPSAAEGCAWGANVSGGTWPYSYQWEWDGQVVSTDEFYAPSGGLQSGAHWLTVTVWDATGSDWDGLSVDVHSSYSCF